MRKLVTTVAAALTLGVMGFAAPALADNYPYQGNNGQAYQNQPYNNGGGYQGQGQWNQGGNYDDRGFQPDRRFDNRRFDFDRQNGNFDRWERGWGKQGFNEFRNHQPLSYWRLVRRLEAQGYYGVRGLRQAQWGWGYRAFAYNQRGRPVMLRINPYSGRVLDVRYI